LSALATDGTASYYQSARADPALAGPSTPVLASLSSNERQIFLVMANGSWSCAVPCRTDVRGFGRFSATGVALGNAQLDDKPLLRSKEEFVSALPLNVSEEMLSCALLGSTTERRHFQIFHLVLHKPEQGTGVGLAWGDRWLSTLQATLQEQFFVAARFR
jgi:hypothetical protein